ncbi:hypothetical protein GALMADRAFT_498072 [Galerina marginata CBS 339.88]|uniref:F-box domain-containing protein n=1 Tax=Galerina marginata (strain CBS 339.88) TaxID=685588 RepID=A0A067T712_GALM3|nr:hypothetical protein GALMADRAFT_498072 [Galerina marginata CBS 339.88]
MVFPLSHLPLELALDILRLAASTETDHNIQSRHQIYQTASALALVSSNVRQVVMPHLLHTIILNTQDTINLFLRTLQQQIFFSTTDSRLNIDYIRHVRHIWSSQCWEPFAEQPKSYFQNYRLLYQLFCRAETLGLNFSSVHLLYEVLGGVQSDYLPNWTCKRVTFAGETPRWNSITSTSAGLAFLKQITHLTVWSPTNDTLSSPSAIGGVPNWVNRIPFHLMPNLAHLAFTFVNTAGSATTPVLVYSLPPTPDSSQEGPTIFRTWASASDPLAYGSIFHLDIRQPSIGSILDVRWEMAYYSGKNDIWTTSSPR